MDSRTEHENRLKGEEASDTQCWEYDSTTKAVNIPLEIVSEDEMAFIEAALCRARYMSSLSLSPVLSESSSWKSEMATSRKCQRKVAFEDMEDLGSKPQMSPLQLHRPRRGLSVTDITASEWCEKQMEFVLIHGRPQKTAAMKVGSARHTELEAEVLTRVELDVQSKEDSWAVRLANFIVGTNQLLFKGLTRELPVVGLVEDVWLIGVIDEARMCDRGGTQRPLLVDTKTRSRAIPPSEPQKRNAKLQLMCYKFLWDRIVTDDFPSSSFYNFFGLHPHRPLSKDVKEYLTESSIGTNVQTLNDLMEQFRSVCKALPLAHEPLLVRYELQADRSLLGEDEFCFEPNWLESQLHWYLQYWLGQREASCVPQDECWKCRFCSFATICPRVHPLSKEEK